MELVEQFAWIGWLVLILIFLTIEALTLDFTFLMLGVGSIGGLVADLVGAPLWLQVIVAGALAILLILLLRPPLLRRLHRGEDPTPTNVEALIGMGGTVVSTVSSLDGQVKLSNGDVWTARTGVGELPPGSRVSVVRIEGATAVVAAPVIAPEEGPAA